MLKPMGWGLSILYFGVPALLMLAGFYGLMPWLIQRGMYAYPAYVISLGLPLLMMLVAALAAYWLEGNPLTWQALLERFRITPLSWRDLVIVAMIFVAEMIGYIAVTRLSAWLMAVGVIPLPTGLPDFVNPHTLFTTQTIDAATGGLSGNWVVFFLSVGLLGINVVGEELWWRGLILPRQELAFLGSTVLIHSLLWTAIHAYKYWDLLNLLPLSIGLTLAVVLLRNTSAGLLIHFITNGVGLIPILMGVIGRN